MKRVQRVFGLLGICGCLLLFMEPAFSATVKEQTQAEVTFTTGEETPPPIEEETEDTGIVKASKPKGKTTTDWLPQTGEQQAFILLVIGILLLTLGGGMWTKRQGMK